MAPYTVAQSLPTLPLLLASLSIVQILRSRAFAVWQRYLVARLSGGNLGQQDKVRVKRLSRRAWREEIRRRKRDQAVVGQDLRGDLVPGIPIERLCEYLCFDGERNGLVGLLSTHVSIAVPKTVCYGPKFVVHCDRYTRRLVQA